MTPDQGRRGTSGKSGGGKASGPAATRRLGLLIFGVAFVALFAIVAISVGVGDPSIPSKDVILVENTPGDSGEITAAKVAHTIELSGSQGEEKPPKPGDPKYEEVKEGAIKYLLEGIWIQGIAAEWGLEVTDAEIEKRFEKLKSESFPSEAEYQKFLKESPYTPADIKYRVKVELLGTKLQEKLKEKAPEPSRSEIEAYYEAAKSTQFTQKASRDVRLVVNKDREKAEEASAALSKDNTAGNWNKVAKKYSENPATKASGGLQKGVQEGTLEEPLNAEVFSTPEGQIEGPLETKRGYNVFEVVNSTPESVQDLKAVESQIQATLAQRLEQEYFTSFLATYTSEWTDRTFCRSGYLVERCANFKGSGHSQSAPEACYEADPDGGRPEACPAPVVQLIPALPGTVTPLEPKGKPLAQRPRPVEEAGEGVEEAPGLPEGAVPPTEAPSE